VTAEIVTVYVVAATNPSTTLIITFARTPSRQRTRRNRSGRGRRRPVRAAMVVVAVAKATKKNDELRRCENFRDICSPDETGAGGRRRWLGAGKRSG
jgi:hypothetical protein